MYMWGNKHNHINYYNMSEVQLACNLETAAFISETVNRDKETGSSRIRAQLDLFSQRGKEALLPPDTSAHR